MLPLMTLDYQSVFDIDVKSPSSIQFSFMSFLSPCVSVSSNWIIADQNFVFQSEICSGAKHFLVHLLHAGIPV